VFYHRESRDFTGGNNALFIVPENTTLTLDSVAFKNNPRRPVSHHPHASIVVKPFAFSVLLVWAIEESPPR
jgi:hypothetical protein